MTNCLYKTLTNVLKLLLHPSFIELSNFTAPSIFNTFNAFSAGLDLFDGFVGYKKIKNITRLCFVIRFYGFIDESVQQSVLIWTPPRLLCFLWSVFR